MFRLLKMLPLAMAFVSTSAFAIEDVQVKRKDASTLIVSWRDSDPVDIAIGDSTLPNQKIAPVVRRSRAGSAEVSVPSDKRLYLHLLDHGDKSWVVAAERELPLEKGSNFRDLGGYKGAGGKSIRWGKIFRSGAMPMLSEADYALLGQLKINSIVDLRSLDERQVAPTQLDDRTGALYISNDYSLAPLMASTSQPEREYVYRGMGKLLAPQYRAIFRRLLADEGAVMYNCSAGQDRTGIASALILTALGVDRETILKDYHLSTALRRPQNEMPAVNPADYPGNLIVQYYVAASKKPGGAKPEPLYSTSGKAHLTQFFELIEREYGSVEGYLKTELGIGPLDVAKLRAIYLS